VTSSAERYRRYARQCLQMAPTFEDKEARTTLLTFAQGWSRLEHLAIANQHIAELMVEIAHRRAVVKDAVEKGQRLEMPESLLHALEESLRIFERHRIFLLSYRGSFSAPPTCDVATGRSLSRRNEHRATPRIGS
jgi:hypothetical protein